MQFKTTIVGYIPLAQSVTNIMSKMKIAIQKISMMLIKVIWFFNL